MSFFRWPAHLAIAPGAQGAPALEVPGKNYEAEAMKRPAKAAAIVPGGARRPGPRSRAEMTFARQNDAKYPLGYRVTSAERRSRRDDATTPWPQGTGRLSPPHQAGT
jgi:hypothetical protein